jgi:uncharacterized membrane protein YhaH (DUF805 family)
MASETFEQVYMAAQAEGSLTPAWKKFVNTKFFVAIVRSPGNDPRDFTLHHDEASGKPAVTISEVRERLAGQPGQALLALSGADVVRRLHAECDILVALSDRAFHIAKERVLWLKSGIEAAQARAEKARQAAATSFPTLDVVPQAAPARPASAPAPLSAAPSAPPAAAPATAKATAAPALVPLAKAGSAATPDSPARRNQVGVLDVAALKPRNVTFAKLGLDFFVPADWAESATGTGLRFHAAQLGCTVEVGGMQRDNVSLAQWQEMRLALVRHELRFLEQDGASYPFEGDTWRGRVQGSATEFAGTFPGDDAPSRYLVACIWSEGVLAVMTIKCAAAVFEQQRALFKWLLSRIDMQPAAAAVYSPPASAARHAGHAGASCDSWDSAEAPPMFGFSLAGRMGRLRVLAYSFPMMLALAVVGIVAAALIGVSPVLGGALAVVGMGLVVWFSLRLMVLRMHDVNMSGKWLLGIIVAIALAVLTRNFMFLAVSSLIFWAGSLIIYCFVPGTSGDNEYGEQPGPNSTLIKVAAGLFILFQLAQIGGAARYAKEGRDAFGARFASRLAGSAAAADSAFTPPDSIFSVSLPGVPQEVELPPAMLAQLDGIAMRQYQLVAGTRVYMLQSIDYRDRVPDDMDEAMEGMQESFVGSDGTLIESTELPLPGASAREVKVSLPGGRLRAARFAIVGSKVCMASITVQDGEQANAQVDAFLASFTLHD